MLPVVCSAMLPVEITSSGRDGIKRVGLLLTLTAKAPDENRLITMQRLVTTKCTLKTIPFFPTKGIKKIVT